VRILVILACLVSLLWSGMAAAALTNRLVNNPSPYLAIHGKDPVAWQEWNRETIETARRENKLLFVSIGYFSCHWCHVMQRETYSNAGIAKVLNGNFIPVKVDREIQGALDAQMQEFAMRTRGRSGWPLNVFITPEGYPLYATLYSPPAEFEQIVLRLAEKWKTGSEQLKKLAGQGDKETPKPVAAEARFAPTIGKLYQTKFIQEALSQADMLRGGFGTEKNANKFPMYPQLAALLEIQRKSPDPRLEEFLKLTLDQMWGQGLHDQVGGGFFRYTIDPDWRIPHFEKMLYDNAQLALLYLRAAQVLKEKRYQDIAFSTLGFMLATMSDSGTGALLTSTSAVDDQNREGAYYLWDKDALRKNLSGEEYRVAEKIWHLDQPPEFQYGYLPMLETQPSTEELQILQGIDAKLSALRSARILPKDQKIITGLNGLALQAFSEAGSLEPRYRIAARKVRDFIAGEYRNGRLMKGVSQGVSLGKADLDDYAYASAGLLSYARMAGNKEDEALARKLVEDAWQKFYGDAGWKLEEDALLAKPYLQSIVPDGAASSPSGVLIQTSWQMGGKALRTNALKALNTGYGILDQGVFWYGTQVTAMNSL
jgi:uncharacterized protein YyaL (SSP411 family)